MSNVPFYQRRASAVALVLLSGLAILCLSIAFQALAWLLPNLFRSVGADLPEPTLLFVDVFGVRSEGYLLQVIWWLWWPMIGALAGGEGPLFVLPTYTAMLALREELVQRGVVEGSFA